MSGPREGPPASLNAMGDGAYSLSIPTTQGEIGGVVLHHRSSEGMVVLAPGAMGRLEGPANLFVMVSERLAASGIGSVRLRYRRPGELNDCVADVLRALDFLDDQALPGTVLVGHSFGGAVVCRAAAQRPDVRGVALLASQLYGTEAAGRLTPRPLLIVHGANDQVIPVAAGHLLYERAEEPKELVIYEGAGHGLVERQPALIELLVRWCTTILTAPGQPPAG